MKTSIPDLPPTFCSANSWQIIFTCCRITDHDCIFSDRSNFEATPPPILIDNGLAVLENDKIERHIMKNIPGGHNLFVQDKDVAQRTENVYSVSVKLFYLVSQFVNLKSFDDVNNILHQTPYRW